MKKYGGWDVREVRLTKYQTRLLQPLFDRVNEEGRNHAPLGMVLMQYIRETEEPALINAVYVNPEDSEELRQKANQLLNRLDYDQEVL